MDIDNSDDGPEFFPEDDKLDPADYRNDEINSYQAVADAEDEPIVCICGGLWKPCMTIGCDLCNQWFHIDCVGLSEAAASAMDFYHCDSCKGKALHEAEVKKGKKGRPAASNRGPNAAFGAKKSSNPCNNPGCAKMARIGSLYCSHNCGLAHAVSKIRKEREETKRKVKVETDELIREAFKKFVASTELPKAHKQTLPLLDVEELKLIEGIKNEYAENEKNKRLLAEEQKALNDALAVAANYNGPIESAEQKQGVKKAPTTEVIDCASCGHTFAASAFSKHIITCFYKVDTSKPAPPGYSPTVSEDGTQIVTCDHFDKNSQTYCKKLKASCSKHSPYSSKNPQRKPDTVAVCGCPLPSGDFCKKGRKDCIKHSEWNNNRQATIQLLEISYSQLEKALNFEEKMIMARILARHNMLPSDYEMRKKVRNPNLDDREVQLAQKRAFDERTRQEIEAQLAAVKTKK